MKNFLKGLCFLMPLTLAAGGVTIFFFCDPAVAIIFKIILEVFCGIIVVLVLFLFTLLIVWGVKNALLQIFKIKLKV